MAWEPDDDPELYDEDYQHGEHHQGSFLSSLATAARYGLGLALLLALLALFLR